MYIGSQWRLHSPKNRSFCYQSDTSGKIEYLFDEDGYRLTLSDGHPSLVIYVSGCSLTFGVGLMEADTWPAILVRSLRERHGLAIGYRNFAQGGASNAYIARSLISESQAKRPDVIVAHLTYKNRTEYNGGDVAGVPIGPWSTEDHAMHYYAYYSDQEGVISSLKDLLLLKFFCESRGIELYFSSEDPDLINSSWPGHNAVSKCLRGLVGEHGYIPSKLWKKDTADRAADEWHPGPIAQSRHAAAIETELLNSRAVKSATLSR